MSVVEKCAMQECLRKEAEEPVQSEVMNVIALWEGTNEKKEVILLLSLQVDKNL